jgi:hypothetical protein
MPSRLPTLAAVAALLLSVPAAFADASAEAKSKGAGVVHTVIIYLKKDAPSGAADEILADCHEMLAKVPTVRLLKAGRSVEGAAAPAKKDYAVALMILFDDPEGLKTYINHPLHRNFIAKHGKNIDLSKIAVYDFAEGKK